LLGRYVDFLLDPDAIDDDPALAKDFETTLLDLVALSLGARREVAEVANMRGLRAVRIQAILAEIRRGYLDPHFSPLRVATKLGLSSHYVQNLLSETGSSFTERVLELRLQQARSMLSGGGRRRISDIAYACGFNEVSYFNRCFRRRFGAPPSQFLA
jgi:AraC-like DNA-binding protein